MEGSADDKAVSTSLCFVSDHVGFQGTIKNFPSDFKVTEIDLSGRLVTQAISDDSPPEPTKSAVEESVICSNCRKRLKAREEVCEANSLCKPNPLSKTSSASEASQTSEIADAHGTFENVATNEDAVEEGGLHALLEPSVNEALEQFAFSVRKDQPSKSNAAEGAPEFSLGLFPEKSQRARVHRAVRQKFPFLMTVTHQAGVTVKRDPHHTGLCQLVSEEEADGFFRFLDAKSRSATFTFRPDGDKEHRKTVHHFVSKHFGKLLETKSFSGATSSCEQGVAITVRFKVKNVSSKKRNAVDLLDKEEIYTAFTLCKENMETLEALCCLASVLDVLPSDFSYAGIKDKRAITYQAIVVKKVTPEKFKNSELALRKKGLKVYNLRPASQHLRLGQLKGNHFHIIVRNLKPHSKDSFGNLKEQVCEAIDNVKAKGFLNYYGPQRFGQGQNVQADHIGLALLKEEMVKAVKLLFEPEEGDDPVNRAKRHFLQTDDVKGALSLMPEFKVRERMILRALNRYGLNSEGCTRGWFSIPHSMRIFYVHAYCSKIWNEAASYRLQTYGQKAVEGDLVILDNVVEESSSQSNQVHVITAQEEASGVYTFSQVVLPMLGNSIQYPKNKVGELYHEALAREGLEACTFRIPILKLNVPGCYRRILAYPQNLIYQLTEEGEINKKEDDDKLCSSVNFQLPVPHVSLDLSFQLDLSCYATVCLREIMKFELGTFIRITTDEVHKQLVDT
ncbi:pseudouridylate synthase PUS7L [Latimeria chalumnae]|uniref:pseudouridylate synthase PUS7L n=1 Tax=Latimeria chalumnae TaxID=7897 RepID=UPI00313DC133